MRALIECFETLHARVCAPLMLFFPFRAVLLTVNRTTDKQLTGVASRPHRHFPNTEFSGLASRIRTSDEVVWLVPLEFLIAFRAPK